MNVCGNRRGDPACPDGNALPHSAEVSGRTGVPLVAKARMGTGLKAIEDALHRRRNLSLRDDVKRLSADWKQRRSTFAIELVFGLEAAVAGRPDRTLHVVFEMPHSATHGSGCQPFICLEKSTGTFAI